MKALFKNPVLNLLSSVKLGAVLMVIVAIGSTAGTFIESYMSPSALFFFLLPMPCESFMEMIQSSVGGREAAYGTVYAATWFEVVMALMIVNLTLSFIKRAPYKLHQIGFATIHFAMIVILISAGITRFMGYEGSMPIREGATTDYIYTVKTYASVASRTQEASFPVNAFKRGNPNRWSKVVVDGETFDLGVVEFWPRFTQVYREGEGGPAGFQFRTSEDGEIVSKVMRAGERINIGDSPATLFTHGFSGEMSGTPYGDLRVRHEGEICSIPVFNPDGVVHTCGSLSLEIIEFNGSYTASGNKEADDELKNPMIRVKINDGRGREGERILFAHHPDFSMSHNGGEDLFGDLDMVYTVKTGVEFNHLGDRVQARASFPIETMNMETDERGMVAAGEIFELKEKTLYVNEGWSFNFFPMRIMKSVVLAPAESEDPKAPAAARMVLRDGEGHEASAICVQHSRGESVQLNGKSYRLNYGSIKLYLDYSLTLDDFVLNTYPGSDNPATYESYVTLNDPEKGIQNEKVHIYMNNPLSHRGSKHFQSSYDPDRRGTVLTVNHDPGKIPTYIGYTLISLGFILLLFKNLMKPKTQTQPKTLMSVVLLAALLIVSGVSPALAHNIGEAHSHDHALTDPAPVNGGFVVLSHSARDLASRLVIQDFQGRMKPLDTLAREMTMKVARSTKFQERHPVDMFLNWSSNPQYWWTQDVVGLRHEGLKALIGVAPETKRVSMSSLFDDNGYRLTSLVREAHRTPDRDRSKTQRKLISFDERFNLLYMTFQGSTLRLFPVPGDANNTWLSMADVAGHLTEEQRVLYQTAVTDLTEGLQSGENSRIMRGLEEIHAIQLQYGSEVIPSDASLSAELFYNKSHLFSWSMVPLLGAFVLLHVVFYLNLFRNRMGSIPYRNVFYSLGMLMYMAGLVGILVAYTLRWIASGRAPLSNGHESLLFIALAAVVAGWAFEQVFRIGLSASMSALLTVIILGVSMLSVFDPAIGPLVPVLVSYWLNIHVTVITASYALFGLSFLIGLEIMILILIRHMKKNEAHRATITFSLNVLDKINFWFLVVGIGLLTIGTLLGGVWANESWGRYWGWDPKETWSLITILVASVGLHFRYITGMRNLWLNAWWNWWVLLSVLMTYFGVNFFLAGMHSYGSGDGSCVPLWVHIFNLVMAMLTVVSGVAFFKHRQGTQDPD